MKKLKRFLIEQKLYEDTPQELFSKYMKGNITLKQLTDKIELSKIASKSELEKTLKNKTTLGWTADDHNIAPKEVEKKIKELLTVIKEEAPVNVTGGVAVVDKPLFKKPLKRKNPDEMFSETDAIFDVDSDMYKKCELGKKKYSKWNQYIDQESELGAGIRHTAKSKNVMIRNSNTGAMIKLTNWKK